MKLQTCDFLWYPPWAALEAQKTAADLTVDGGLTFLGEEAPGHSQRVA